VKRLLLRQHSLTVLGYKTAKLDRQWGLDDIMQVKRHPLNYACFVITCLEQKKKKMKKRTYSFEVRTELECMHWIEMLNTALAAHLEKKDREYGGTLTRNRSTSAPPHMGDLVTSSNKSDEDGSDHYSDHTDEDEETSLRSSSSLALREKGTMPSSTPADVNHEKENWAHFQSSTPLMPTKQTSSASNSSNSFNPFNSKTTVEFQKQAPLKPQSSPVSHYPQQQNPNYAPLSPRGLETSSTLAVKSPSSPPASSSTFQMQHTPSVYITTMAPPAHIRIVQDLGLISATGTAAAPTNPSQCGPQAEAALQTAMQELSTRAFTRGANAVFQTSFSTAFHQWGVTVLACGSACTATMVNPS